MSYPGNSTAPSDYSAHQQHQSWEQPAYAHYQQQTQASSDSGYQQQWEGEHPQQYHEAQWNQAQHAQYPPADMHTQPYQAQSQMNFETVKYDQQDSTMALAVKPDETTVADTEVQAQNNWRRRAPERTTFMLAWFAFFSLGSVALTLTALFGCYSPATNNLYIVRLQPSEIYNASVWSLASRNSTSNASSIPRSEFFTTPLPQRYEIGIAGVCRVIDSPKLSSPAKTECTPQLHTPLDLLRLISQDIPGGTSSTQYRNREQLLMDAFPGIHTAAAVAQRARLITACSALLILSIICSLFLVLATLLIPSMYPRRSIVLGIVDALLVLGGSSMWTIPAAQVTNAYAPNSVAGVPQGAHTGPGFWVLWAIGFAKLALTPFMLWMQIMVVIALAAFAIKVFYWMLQMCASEPNYVVETTYVVDSNPGYSI